jgi:hypothetical protein
VGLAVPVGRVLNRAVQSAGILMLVESKLANL